MKALLSIAVFASVLAACGVQSSHSETDGIPDLRGRPGLPGLPVSLTLNHLSMGVDEFRLVRDMLPVDGERVSFEFKWNGSSYDLTKTTSWYDRFEARLETKSEDLAFGLACRILVIDEEGEHAVCERDDRPVDGEFVQIFLKGLNGEHSIKQRLTYYDRLEQKEISKANDLGANMNLELINNLPL